MKSRYQTKCTDCNKILTKNGTRYHSCTFDSRFETKPMTKYRVWGRCEKCYKKVSDRFDVVEKLFTNFLPIGGNKYANISSDHRHRVSV